MENVISRHKNLSNLVVLVAVLFVQVLGLAVQVKKKTDSGSVRLLRHWAVSLVTPVEKLTVHSQGWMSRMWKNYVDLRQVREDNRDLRDELARMRLEQVRLMEDANQARRLQLLLGFKEKYMSQTMPAQVISTTGSDFSRGIYIDKGANHGIQQGMPVITPEGVVGKVLRVDPSTSLVLEINDPSSGVGVILEKSRLQGILKGNSNGEMLIHYIMNDENVQPGERVLTSGGDRVFPKGLPVGVVMQASPGPETFLIIKVKPAAPLSQAEEVLVVTKIDEKTPVVDPAATPVRAIDVLAERLPSVPRPKVNTKPTAGLAGVAAKPASEPKPQGSAAVIKSPAGQNGAVLNPNPAATGGDKPDTAAGIHTEIEGKTDAENAPQLTSGAPKDPVPATTSKPAIPTDAAGKTEGSDKKAEGSEKKADAVPKEPR